MKKAYGYLRVSGKDQVKKGGLSDQEKKIRDYAEKNGIEIAKIYREKGVSGTTENREALVEMMVDLEENGHGVKTVLIDKVNRLARDLMVQENIIANFRKNGFELIACTEDMDLLSQDPTRKLVRQVLGAISEYDKTMLVEKLRVARERKRAINGKCEGRKSWKEKNPEVLKEVKKLRRKKKGQARRMSFAKIAEALNSKGYRNSTGGKFTGKAVESLYNRNV